MSDMRKGKWLQASVIVNHAKQTNENDVRIQKIKALSNDLERTTECGAYERELIYKISQV